MPYKTSIIYFLAILAVQCLAAQNNRFGNVSEKEFLQGHSPHEESPSATVLYRSVVKNFFYVPQRGFRVETLVYKKIRINSREGFGYATVSRNLYKTKSFWKSMGNIKGATYNMEEGKLVKTKLKPSDIYHKTLSSDMDQETFTMPAVKEGSIIEYQYRVDSPFTYSLEEISLQYQIPVLEQDITIKIPEYFNYNQWIKGYLPVEPIYSTSNESIDVLYRSGENRGKIFNNRLHKNTFNYLVTTTNYHMEDVPALRAESHIDHLDNYRATLMFELHWVDFPNKDREEFANNWESVIKTIYRNEKFGKRLGESAHFKETVDLWTSGLTSKSEKAITIFRKLQGHMNWNGRYAIYAERPLLKVFAEKSGNSAEINLLLVAMLRQAGLTAQPLLISTVSNGVPLFPTIRGFNHVAAATEVDHTTILLDASDWRTSPNILSKEALNWLGMLIEEGGTHRMIPLVPSSLSISSHMMHTSIDLEGVVTGRVRSSHDKHLAMMYRRHDKEILDPGYPKEVEGRRNINVSDYEFANIDQPGQAVLETYKFSSSSHVTKAGNRLVFNPLFFNAMKETPFQEETRKLPVYFGFPWKTKNMITIELPEGFEIMTLPGNLKMNMSGNLGSFSYQIEDTGLGQLQLRTEFQINQGIVPAEKYGILKEFYKNVAKKVAEPVVLTKIDGYEHQEVTTGGR